MNAFAVICLCLSVLAGVKATLSFTGFLVYHNDITAKSRDIVLKRRKKFKFPRYLILAIVFFLLALSQIKSPSISLKPIQSLEIAPHE